MIKERDINRNHFRWNNDDNISISSNYDIIKEDDISTLYDDNFSILSDYSSIEYYSNYGAPYPNNINNNINNDEEKVDESGLRLLLQM